MKSSANRKVAGSTTTAGAKAVSHKSTGQSREAVEMLHDIERRAKDSINRAHAVIAKLA
jgi:hypothetical protein